MHVARGSFRADNHGSAGRKSCRAWGVMWQDFKARGPWEGRAQSLDILPCVRAVLRPQGACKPAGAGAQIAHVHRALLRRELRENPAARAAHPPTPAQ